MTTTKPGLSAHLRISSDYPGDGFLHAARAMLRDRFGIAHAGLQVKTGDQSCAIADEHGVLFGGLRCDHRRIEVSGTTTDKIEPICNPLPGR